MSESEGRATWAGREQPILEAILAVEEDDRDRLGSDELATTVGLAESVIVRTMTALYEADYVTWSTKVGLSTSKFYMLPRLLERGRRAVGQWPADGFDALVALLDERIRDEPDEAKKSRLVRFRDSVLGMGRDIAVDVLGAWLKHVGGI